MPDTPPLDGHRPDLSSGRMMSLLWSVTFGLWALGPWGLSCLGGRTAAPPIEHREAPAVQVAAAPHDELPPTFTSQPSTPPPALDSEQEELAALLADEADHSDEADTASSAPPPLVKDSHLSRESQILVGKLLKPSEFALGGVGYAGQMSDGEKLTRQLSHQADAIAAFDWLVNQSTLVARLYAYWALRTLAPEHAQAHLGELLRDHRRVLAFHGCLGARYHVRYLLREVERRPMPRP